MSDVVDQITLGLSRPYFRNILRKLRENNQENADIICKHILTEHERRKDSKLSYWLQTKDYIQFKDNWDIIGEGMK